MEAPSGSSASLTPEQLLEYIKKQKTKIKKLEKEKETLIAKHAEEIATATSKATIATETEKVTTTSTESQNGDVKVATTTSSSSLSSNNGALFWDMLEKEPPFPRKLAKVALSMLLNTIIKSNKGKQFQPSRRSLFDQWRLHTLEMRVEMAVRHATEAKANMQILEQKTVKLKALLARTHQANKRFEEDTTSFKRAQKDAAQQLKAIKERDEEQRMALLETVRVRTIESAFQQDMELAIQRAAESNYNSNSSNNLMSSSSMSAADKATMHALENENNHLKTQLEATEGSIVTLQSEAKQRQAQVDKLEKEYQRSKDALDKLSAKCMALENQAAEHARSRHDMELELELLTKGRADMIRCVESAMADKSAQHIAELKAEINMLRNNQQVHRPQQPKSNHTSSSSNGVASGSSSNSMNKDNKAISGSQMSSTARGYHRSTKTAADTSSTSSTSSMGGGLIYTPTYTQRPPVGTITALSAEEAAAAITKTGHQHPHDGNVSSPSSFSSSSSSTTFTCESLIIKAATDFRLVVPVPAMSQTGNFRLSWDFEVAIPSSSSATTKRTRVVDIGFCIMEKLSTGSLPQLLPYCRVKSPGERNSLVLGSGSTMDTSTTPSFARSLVLLFDNSYSWLQSKEIKYTITVEPVS